MEIGNRIHEIRTENNLSQSEFADLFHVSRQAVSNWENGKNYPDMNTLAMISDRFGISFDELIKEDASLIEKIDTSVKGAGRWKRRFLTVLIFLLGMVIAFATPYAIKKLYYDPTETVYTIDSDNYLNGSEEQRLTIDMQVYSTLLMPGHKFDDTTSRDMGMGKYAFTMSQSASYGKAADVSGQIVRDNLQIYDPNTFKLPYGNAFEWTTGSRKVNKSLLENIRTEKEELEKYDDSGEGEIIYPNSEDSKNCLKELNDSDYYEAYISFNKVMTYSDALKWIEKYIDDLFIDPWVGVVTSDDVIVGPIGFYLYPSGYIRGFDKEKYPYLLGYEDYDEAYSEDSEELRSEDNAKQHVISMLKYLCDQKRFRRMMENAGYGNNFENNIDNVDYFIDYISQNGIKVYGVAVCSQKDNLSKLHEDKEVFSISTEEL